MMMTDVDVSVSDTGLPWGGTFWKAASTLSSDTWTMGPAIVGVVCKLQSLHCDQNGIF